MSGIAVIYDPVGRQERIQELVPTMCWALQKSDREGPVEWYVGPGFGVGRCRPVLINQVSQPVWNEGRTICLVFHGELFGYNEAVSSQAELLVHLYEEKGEAFVHELNGSFALALWDERQQKLIIANDRYGLCPLYHAVLGGAHVWASSPKAILAWPSFQRQINLAALADFLCLGFPQGSDTMFEGIEETLPASLVICQQGRIHCQQHWDLSFQEDETGISADDYLEELIPLLEQAATRRQEGKWKVGLLLSGGLDSRVVLSALDRDNVKAFTFGVPHCNDVRFARQAAKALNVPHFALQIQPDYLEAFAWTGIQRTEDLINCDQFHGISIYDEVASHVNVLITGSAGEDVFGEFPRDPHGGFWGDATSIVDRYFDTLCAITDEELELLIRPPYFQKLKGLARSRFHKDFQKYPSRHTSLKESYWSIKQLQRRRSNRLSSLFPADLLFRPLYYDNDLVDFAQTIPPSLRWGENSLYRRAILVGRPELARIPATTTYGLPLSATHEQMARRRHRYRLLRRWHRRLSKVSLGVIPPMRTTFFADYGNWLKRELRGWAESILFDPRTLSRELWDPSAITFFWEEYLRGPRRGIKNLDKKITALITLELWHRMYKDNVP